MTSENNSNSPAGELLEPHPENAIQKQQLQSSPNPTTPPLAPNSGIPATADSKLTTPAVVNSRALGPSSSLVADVIHIPSYSRWFSWSNIHKCEVRFVPEFFDGRSPSKTPKVYKYYRNTIIRRFREDPTRKITFTEARKTIIGDVGSIRRVFDFLEVWGLINYSGSILKLKWEDKESKSNAAALSLQSSDPVGSSADFTALKKRLCSGCKSVCSIACFSCDKYDLTLCARCYVRGNYRVGVNSSDFRRVEISEETKTDWTDKETLHLLEAVMHFGTDWKKVTEHVGGRSEKECVARFVKLPFGGQFVGPPDCADVDDRISQTKDQSNIGSILQSSSSPSKRMRLTPLADASNPIMAQASFLSALAGVDVAEAAAQAATRALSEAEGTLGAYNGGVRHHVEEAYVETRLQLEKEEQNLERAVSGVVAVQAKQIQDKILHFEEFELQIERKWQQVKQMMNLLFVDKLVMLSDKTAPLKSREENLKAE